jgi:hypothetical protein
VGSALAQDAVTVETDEVTAAIKGQDVTIHARVSAEVDEVKLFIRRLLELGEFNDLAMEKTGAFNWRYTLPLSQQAEDVGRLEYYMEAYRGGQPVARSENFVISFIDPPFIGEASYAPTVGLDKAAWNDLVKGRIKRPFYKRWWVYAIAGAVAIPVTAVLAGGGADPIEPVTLDFDFAAAGVIRSSIDVLCPQQPIPFVLTIVEGEPPYQVIFTVQNTGGNTIDEVGGPGAERVVVGGFLQDVRPANEGDTTTVVNFDFPGLTVRSASPNSQNPVRFRAIVRDAQAPAFSANPAPGQPLPSQIETDLLEETRIRDIDEVDTMFTITAAPSFQCPAVP